MSKKSIDDPIIEIVDAEFDHEAEAVDGAAGEEGLIAPEEIFPEKLLVLPTRGRPLFPGMPAPIEIDEEQIELIREAAEEHRGMFVVVRVLDEDEDDSPKNLREVGTAVRLIRLMQTPDGAQLMVNGLHRVTLSKVQTRQHGLMAKVEYRIPPDTDGDDELKAFAMAMIATLKELIALNPLQSDAIKLFFNHAALDEPGRVADFAATLTSADPEQLQEVLATFEIRSRIELVLLLLKKEVELAKIQGKISKQIEERISGQQREFFLREQLKAIKKELGIEKEGKTAEIDTFRERLSELTLNDEVREVIDTEMDKLEMLDPASAEYNVSRNYLDWLTVLPWGKNSEDAFDLERAAEILDEDHYGLDDVKKRILEFIAVGKLKGDISGSILCLVGPPGVGKTSIGRSVAASVGREFFRFSLGGMRDEAEIKGHRRTYIGAMPGKFIQAVKTVQTSNPVIMLDEIDKIGASFRGDPASALLEVLDPEQNGSFRDHYLDVPFDLSNVLFVATANQLDTIPRPLLDRMEVIRLSGYILQEKLEIAKRYLIPKGLKRTGLKKSQVTILKSALVKLIDGYAREAGVRNLEQQIRKIFRKAAMEIAMDPKAKVRVTADDIVEYLGKPRFEADEQILGQPGVVTGLAWTSMGGATLQIESTAVQTRGKGFKQTGQLGNVMKESAEIAYSYVMARLEKYGADPRYFDEHFVHLHVPAGATPKDGPSAGVTMATALISMVKGVAPRKKLAMTGELTLTGQVLPIGGVKEKVIAARRSGYKTLVFPEANRRDVEELPEYLREKLDFHFATTYDDVFAVAFG